MDNTPDRPSGDDDRDDDAGQNPFKGTPFEQMFGALGGALAGRCPTSARCWARCST